MSLNSILNIATSGLGAAQSQLRVVSDNVSNVNTPGYVRKIAEQVSRTSQGVGAGVEVARIRLATDRFLQAASLNASADASRETVRYELYDRIQALFGDPGGDTGFFSKVDGLFSAFAASAENPTSSPQRQDALFKTQALFDEAARISSQIQAVREDADGRLLTAVDRANTLLEQIESLNVEIGRATVISGDASGAETAQAALIQELAGILDIRVSTRAVGGVSIRTGVGLLLAGEGHARLDYARAGSVSSESAFGELWVTEPRGQKRPLTEGLASGEIRGLLQLRDVEAPAAAERLGELMTRVADELNRAHNANTSAPPPSALTGRNVGQSFETAIAGFTGRTTVVITNAAGVVQSRADIVFSGATMTVNGVPATPGSFLTTLNDQLGAMVATFTDGVLKLDVTPPQGIAVADDPTAASNKAGRGFSHYFGLNDLVSTDRPALYDQGLVAVSQLGFPVDQELTFRFTDASGARLRDITVRTPAGGTLADMLAELNSSSTGVGRFGQFTADPTTGAISFKPSGGADIRMGVLEDKTTQVPSGVSLTELFGLGGGVRASRADGFSLRTDIRQSPAKLALAQLNLSATPPASSISTGDGRGALLLADAGERASSFAAAGDSAGGSLSISRYASELAGDIGGRAGAAKSRAQAAQAVHSEAEARQVAHEGVNLDEELVLMATYQQAFNASARLIQAVKDMYDVLLGMT